MKKYIFLLLIVLNSYSQETKIKNDLQKENLVGKVKLVTTASYDTEKSFFLGIVKKGKSWYKNSVIFNIKGDKAIETDSADKIIFKYDDLNNLIEMSKLSMSEGKVFFTVKYKYNQKNELAEMEEYGSKGELSVKYVYSNEGGTVDSYDENGKLTSKAIRIYDDSKNLISEQYFDENGSLGYEIEMKYDKNKVEKIFNDPKHPQQNNREEYLYNEQNDVKIVSRYNSNNILKSMETYNYKYDEKDNWIEKIVKYYKGSSFYTEREIEYYN